MLAAHDPADVVDLHVIGDHRHLGGERIFLLIKCDDGLALVRPPRHYRAG